MTEHHRPCPDCGSSDALAAGENGENVNPNTDGIEIAKDFETRIKRQFAECRSMKIKFQDPKAMIELLNSIMKLKIEGRKAKNLEDLSEALNREAISLDLIEKLQTHRNNKLTRHGVIG